MIAWLHQSRAPCSYCCNGVVISLDALLLAAMSMCLFNTMKQKAAEAIQEKNSLQNSLASIEAKDALISLKFGSHYNMLQHGLT